MHSRVLLAEGELERRLRAAEETYVRRLVREDTRRLEAAQFRRWKT